ncbi:MAG TPA: tetratricopeptide repeat protein [Candidatus Polarisedimenticolia bacterium]|nr:tetratricopeptide repeat protein [Candidatus Polarisedimenticolia bacterium]
MGSLNVAVLLITAVSVVLAQESIPRVEPHDKGLYQQAESEYSNSSYVMACRDFKRLLETDNSAAGWSNYGVACHMAGNIQEAVAALEKALEMDPRMVPANLILGIDYVRLGKSREAISLFEAVLDQQADNRDALIDLATAHFALGDFEQAAKNFRREVTLRPNDVDAWYGLGTSFEHVAEETSRKLSSVGKDSTYFYRLIGRILLEQDLPVDAEEAFLKALAASSGREEDLRAEMGFALLRANQISNADHQFRGEIELNPHSQTARLGLAGVDFTNARFEEGIAKLCKVHQTDTDFFTIHIPLLMDFLSDETKAGMIGYLQIPQNVIGCSSAIDTVVADLKDRLAGGVDDRIFGSLQRTAKKPVSSSTLSGARIENENGQYTECFRHLEVASPTSLRDQILLARCATLTGHFESALEVTGTAQSRASSSPAALYWHSEAARALAKAAFSKAVALNDETWQGQLLLGDLYRQKKKWNLAISHYANATQLKPDSPGPHLGAATIYWETGLFDKAQLELEKVLLLDADNVQACSELADILVRQHQFQQALPLLLKVGARDPGLLLTHANLGKVYAHTDRVPEAVKELVVALPSDSTGELHYQLYSLYKKLGKTKEAQEALAESERLRVLAEQQKAARTTLQQTVVP